jgi:hypothetical protein
MAYQGLSNLLELQGRGLTRNPQTKMYSSFKIADLIPIVQQQASGAKVDFSKFPIFPQLSPMQDATVYKSLGGSISDNNVSNNDYVIDAYTVSALGSGSSDAGHKMLDEILPEAENSDGSFYGRVEGNGDGMSDEIEFKVTNDPEIHTALISKDERIVDEDQVRKLGGGSIDEGVASLDKLRQEIRKATYGDKEQPNQMTQSALDKILEEI